MDKKSIEGNLPYGFQTILERMISENGFFSDEKVFDIDGLYNSQNNRIWSPSCAEENKQGDLGKKHKFPVRVMVWISVCSKGVQLH